MSDGLIKVALLKMNLEKASPAQHVFPKSLSFFSLTEAYKYSSTV